VVIPASSIVAANTEMDTGKPIVPFDRIKTFDEAVSLVQWIQENCIKDNYGHTPHGPDGANR